MAKDKIVEYDSTANNNTVVGDVNLAENSMNPSDVNNAIREVMSHQKEAFGAGTPLYVDQANNRVGVNKTPTVALDVNGALSVSGALTQDGGAVFNEGSADVDFRVESNNLTHALFVNGADGKIGIGESVPSEMLHIKDDTNDDAFGGLIIKSNNGTANVKYGWRGADGSDQLRFATGGTERLRIDSEGSITSNTATTGGTTITAYHTSAKSAGITFQNSSSGTGNSNGFEVALSGSGTAGTVGYLWNYENGDIRMATNGSERLRILSGGQLVINSTTLPALGTEKLGVQGGSASNGCAIGAVTSHRNGLPLFLSNVSDTTNTYLARFATGSGGSTRGEIYFNGSALVYATSSDYRLKQNINYDFDATTKLKQLKPAEYRWIEHQKDDIGFLAHEVQEVFPNAVGGEKDEVNDDGSIKPQTYDPSKLVPLLTKTILELEARITALEGA